jgi:pimeloyl-ACP methyl ester carboxylesterase
MWGRLGGVIVTSGKAELACDSAGHGEPVLLLHAGVADSRSWAKVVDVLAPTRQTIAVDRRGYGRTRYEPEPHSHVDDALAVLDHFGVGAAALVGNSRGGRTALDLALAHPERVTRLVLIAPAVRGAPDLGELSATVKALAGAIDAAEAAGDLAEVNRLEAHVWLDGPAAPEGRVGGPARELFLDMNAIALASPDAGEEADLPSAWDRLAEIGVPTLVIVGALDLGVTMATCTALAAAVPGARLEVIPGVAHLPQMEADPTVFGLIDEFLAAPG